MSEVAIPGEGHLRERKLRHLDQNDVDRRMWISVDGNIIQTICDRICDRICTTVEFCITRIIVLLGIVLFILVLKY